MEFVINNQIWKIEEVNKEWLVDKHNRESKDNVFYVFGLCDYPTHHIFINNEVCAEQKLQTLKHELVHCWLWVHGAVYESYSEEDICNKCSAMCDFVSDVARVYNKDCIIGKCGDNVNGN